MERIYYSELSDRQKRKRRKLSAHQPKDGGDGSHSQCDLSESPASILVEHCSKVPDLNQDGTPLTPKDYDTLENQLDNPENISCAALAGCSSPLLLSDASLSPLQSLEEDCVDLPEQLHHVGLPSSCQMFDSESLVNLHFVEDKTENIIKEWIKDNNPSESSSNDLLRKFSSLLPGIAKTTSTLLSHTKNVTTTQMGNGRYSHMNDWKMHVLEYARYVMNIECFAAIDFVINIDGIPFFNDRRRYTGYPILLKVCPKGICIYKIFCCGIYLSEDNVSNKMPHINILLEETIKELKKIISDGFVIDNITIPCKILCVSCDAPARADLKLTVSHNAYNSCERCVQKGSYSGGHVVLKNLQAPLRTDESFYKRTDPAHHRGEVVSVLADLNIGFVSQFPLDYMHLVCIGACKRLLLRWKSGKNKNINLLLKPSMVILREQLSTVPKSIPEEFSRKLSGGFDSISFWKATEFRLFLLYVGIVVAKTLPYDFYVNFLHLSLALRLLLTENQEENLKMIDNLLKNFIDGSVILYGDEFLSYNIHSLSHLTDDYQKFGPLDNVSCFPFENYQGILKRRIHGTYHVLEEVTKHADRLNMTLPKVKKAKENKRKKIFINNFCLKPNSVISSDNVVILQNGEIGVVTETMSDMLFINIHESEPFFLNPINSKLCGIHKINGYIAAEWVEQRDIFGKLMALPCEDGHVGILLLHTYGNNLLLTRIITR